ncbi:MAG: hypothetical protein O2958_04180 [Gemmatimonadetes bacterium]|nr:hypothetical protein [Gemmatimonadota bacterium]MDA1102503.1 hypothetical protein [Gemmatimonadota bacterium]
MTMVDWLLTEQLVEIFRAARAKRPDLNAELEAHSPHGEDEVLAGAGTAVRLEATDGGAFVVTPRRIARVVSDEAYDLVVFADLVGYDWIAPEMSEKVALKNQHFDRLYLYPRDAQPIVLDKLGPAVYPLMTFLGRVLEFQSQKIMLRKLDDDVVDVLGKCLHAAAHGPFLTDDESRVRLGRSLHSLQVVAGMWPRLNLAAPDLRELLQRVTEVLTPVAVADAEAWDSWIGASPVQVEAAYEVFRRVSTGEV